MKNTFSLSIPQPCHANWNEMTPNEQGKFCGLCSLTVVDFTNMSETEIKDYFTCHYGQKTCGRFRSAQLKDAPSKGIKQFWSNQFEKLEVSIQRSYIKAALLCCLTILAFITGCRRPSSYPPHRMGDIELMGEPVQEQVDTLKTKPVPVTPVK